LHKTGALLENIIVVQINLHHHASIHPRYQAENCQSSVLRLKKRIIFTH